MTAALPQGELRADGAIPQPVWVHQTGTPKQDSTLDIAVAPSGVVYSVGWQNGAGWRSQGFIRSYSEYGARRWSDVVPGPSSDDLSWSEFGAVAVTPANDVIVAETLGTYDSWSMLVRKYSPSGELMWRSRTGYSLYDPVYASQVVISRDGAIYVLWNIDASDNRHYAAVQRVDNNGSLRWSREINTGRGDTLNSAFLDSKARLVVAGYTNGSIIPLGSNGGEDGFIRKYSRSGRVQFSRQFGTSGNDRAVSIIGDKKGHLYLGGRTYGGPEQHGMWVKKFSARGVPRWSHDFVAPGTSVNDYRLVDLMESSDGTYLAVGYSAGRIPESPTRSAGSTDIFIRSISATGRHVWSNMLGTGRSDRVNTGAMTGGGLLVGGDTTGHLGNEPFQGRYDAFVLALKL